LNCAFTLTPGEAEVFCNLLRKDGTQEKLTATIDTGASISLFPRELLDIVQYDGLQATNIIVEQAGIAQQAFQAIEAEVTLSLEDASGNITKPLEIRAWFANTNARLIGFADVLERGILHIDMPGQTGWLEID
jgi:hypothetical protein